MSYRSGNGFGGKQSSEKQICNPPSDTVQCLEFAPDSFDLLAGSWDSTVRIWEVDESANSAEKAQQTVGAPVLDVCYRADGMAAFAALCDKTVQMWDFGSNSLAPVAEHDEPIRTCHWIPQHNLLMTGGWDAKIKFWDTRTAEPAAVIGLDDRVYAADVYENMGVIATADRQVTVMDLTSSPEVVHKQETKLSMQTRSVKCFPEQDGFAVSSIEGRCSLQYISQERLKDSFSFKCHRDNQNVYTVNAVGFHNRTSTLVTAGSDGNILFWDKNNKRKTNTLPKAQSPITCVTFSNDENNSIFAYGVGYDWSMGYEGRTKSPDTIMLHIMEEKDVKA
eukprot:m.32495 g.32495  ORF g.32495 m.32495 type:complete len:335 (+) comp9787_c0_seq1:287-1291(+)